MSFKVSKMAYKIYDQFDELQLSNAVMRTRFVLFVGGEENAFKNNGKCGYKCYR
jgi:hypothetical protein